MRRPHLTSVLLCGLCFIQTSIYFFRWLLKGPKTHFSECCKTWIQWLGIQIIMTSFSAAIWTSRVYLLWDMWPHKFRTAFPEGLCWRKCCVNHWWISWYYCMTSSGSCTRLTREVSLNRTFWTLEHGAAIDVQLYSLLSLYFFHPFIKMLKREHLYVIFLLLQNQILYIFYYSSNTSHTSEPV
jgi:hypothetical protein